MTLDFDTFLVALYTIVDDLYREFAADARGHRPGTKPVMHDSEVLTLAILGHWTGRKENALIRYAREHWRAYFPRLLDQSAFNRRVRDLTGLMMHLIPRVAAKLGAEFAAYQVFDGVPVPLMARCRGREHRLFGDEAGIGRGGSDRAWYYGCHLLVAVTKEGIITGFVVGAAQTEGHWLAEDILCWRRDPTLAPWTPDTEGVRKHNGCKMAPIGRIWGRNSAGYASAAPYIVDGGFRGELWIPHWLQDYRALVYTPDLLSADKDSAVRRQHSGWRQIIEAVNGQLKECFHLDFPGARSMWGLLARLAGKLLALNLGVWLNRLFGRDPLAFATLFNS